MMKRLSTFVVTLLAISAFLSGLVYLIYGEIKSEIIFLIITAVTVFWYTYETYKLRWQSGMNQNLTFMSELIRYYDAMREKNSLKEIYIGDPKTFMSEKNLPVCTEVANFLDGVGQIIYHLSEEQRTIALERWAEVYIRSWIRLKDFVEQKRELSIKRDYPYFEWLACRSLEFHDESFYDMDINFYKYNPLREKHVAFEINLINNNRHKFRKPRDVEVEFIRSEKKYKIGRKG